MIIDVNNSISHTSDDGLTCITVNHSHYPKVSCQYGMENLIDGNTVTYCIKKTISYLTITVLGGNIVGIASSFIPIAWWNLFKLRMDSDGLLSPAQMSGVLDVMQITAKNCDPVQLAAIKLESELGSLDSRDLEVIYDRSGTDFTMTTESENDKRHRTENASMQISQEAVGSEMSGGRQECSGCKKSITDRYLLKALDQYWHEDCLKCSCCDCRLGEVGSTLFSKANLLLCRRDYLRLFGTTGYCSACTKMIPAFEMVMRAKSNVYHLECFACQQCNHRFCVGDRFYLCDNKILCEYDYEERMVFASMTYNYNTLSQIKRQTNSLSDDLSSGYGSPSPGSL